MTDSTPPGPPPRRPLETRICRLFGVRYPIIQTGMGWVSGPELTAATSAAGAFGILAAATLSFAELEAAIAEIKQRTDKPFGVNLRADQADVMARGRLLVREGVKVASFAQAPGKKLCAAMREAGVLVMPTIGAQRHAEKVAEWGVDAIIAQGGEGGGHTGSVPTSLLLPQVCATVDIPVIGAGGFFSGQGLVAALAYGASGIAMGTRFLLTRESRVPEEVKRRYLETAVDGTVVTRAVDGYPQRVIRTPLIAALEQAGSLTRVPRAAWNALRLMRHTDTGFVDLVKEGLAMKKNQSLTTSQLIMAANAPMLTRATMVEGRLDVGIMPTGQVVGLIDEGELPSAADLIARIVAEAEQALARLGGHGA